jgi:hypothetical protein
VEVLQSWREWFLECAEFITLKRWRKYSCRFLSVQDVVQLCQKIASMACGKLPYPTPNSFKLDIIPNSTLNSGLDFLSGVNNGHLLNIKNVQQLSCQSPMACDSEVSNFTVTKTNVSCINIRCLLTHCLTVLSGASCYCDLTWA